MRIESCEIREEKKRIVWLRFGSVCFISRARLMHSARFINHEISQLFQAILAGDFVFAMQSKIIN